MRRWADFSRPREHRGFADWLIIVLAAAIPAALLVLFFTLAMMKRVPAHDWYPPSCCSGGDCAPVESSRITRDGVDYVIDHRWRVRRSSTTPSPDGRFHGCWPDKDKPPVCVFAPPDGM